MEECNEYKALLNRNGTNYSDGHQRMYTTPINILAGVPDKIDVLDVGAGIGFGLQKMLEAKIIKNYLGVEPCLDSFNYLKKTFQMPNVQFCQTPWLNTPETFVADYTFCIEVVEHLDEKDVLPFLRKLKRQTKINLFLSTPNSITNNHGAASIKTWKHRLKSAGFDAASIQRQWTTLFIAEPTCENITKLL
jgi:2-polyprenyl-3-methyl-5-hydroxy-6-metoxy-1,4-benzoquinol methylase